MPTETSNMSPVRLPIALHVCYVFVVAAATTAGAVAADVDAVVVEAVVGLSRGRSPRMTTRDWPTD